MKKVAWKLGPGPFLIFKESSVKRFRESQHADLDKF